jgi:hypothetical protein
VSTVYKATIDSNGDIGTFDTTNQGQLPQDLNLHTTVTATIGGTNYIYVLGGENGVQVPQSTVYKATIDSNGDIGTFDTTNQGQLPEALNSHTTVIATIGGTTYIYVLGGCGDIDCPTSTVYKATIDDNGDIGTFDTTSQAQLPQAIYGHTTVTATIGGTNYIYVLETPTVYKATIDGNGDIGTFDTTDQGQLPLAIFSHASTTADVGGTTYIYVVGGTTGGEGRQVDTVYNAPLLELAPSPTDTPTPTPTSAPGSSATNTPTPGPGSPPICTDSKPGNPSNVIATAGPNSGQITLTWIAAPSPVTDYSITYSDNPTTQKYGVVSTSNTTSYVISGLKPNTKYYFWVNAVNGCEPGDQIGSATIGGGAVNDIATPSGNISNSSLLQNSGVNPLPVTGPLDLVKVGGIGAILMLVGAALLLAL